jgi:FkbM family methyltransferase
VSLGIQLRTAAGLARRRLWPTPEQAALRILQHRAEQVARRTPGTVEILDMQLEYVDALSLVPQWQDIFVTRSLEFEPTSDAPRILDCGANVGLASLWLKRTFPRARITAFEADPQICRVLRRNMTANGAADVDVVQAAVWDRDTTLSFRAEGTDAGAIASVATSDEAPAVDVPAVRLRDYIERERVDLLKLDIEGAEYAVLHDIAPVLTRVAALQMEVHDFSPERRLLPGCLDLLQRHGFTYALDELVAATWRREGRRTGPFARAVPAWVLLVRAWQVPQ